MDNLVEILWDQERGPHQLFGRVMSWRVSFFILDSHELESQLFHPPQKIFTNEGCGDVKSQLFSHHMKSSPSEDIGDELEGQIFIHSMNFWLLKDIVLSWRAQYSSTWWIFYYWRLYMVMSWRVKYSSTRWIFDYLRIYGDDFEGQIFIHSMNFLLLKDIYSPVTAQTHLTQRRNRYIFQRMSIFTDPFYFRSSYFEL